MIVQKSPHCVNRHSGGVLFCVLRGRCRLRDDRRRLPAHTPGYYPSQIYACLDNPSTTAAFIEEVERDHRDSLNLSLNLQELATAQLSASLLIALTIRRINPYRLISE
ncbi:MAG: hypothetical protein LBO07_07160 [Coriobacteriales bacterium]|jgi:hypothetical protein|nr:hypothetical protein [Coriobacteriales bacterium]